MERLAIKNCNISTLRCINSAVERKIIIVGETEYLIISIIICKKIFYEQKCSDIIISFTKRTNGEITF